MERKLMMILTDYLLKGFVVTKINYEDTVVTAKVEKIMPAVWTNPEYVIEREITVYADLTVENFKTK